MKNALRLNIIALTVISLIFLSIYQINIVPPLLQKVKLLLSIIIYLFYCHIFIQNYKTDDDYNFKKVFSVFHLLIPLTLIAKASIVVFL
jgi:hypothetical protein